MSSNSQYATGILFYMLFETNLKTAKCRTANCKCCNDNHHSRSQRVPEQTDSDIPAVLVTALYPDHSVGTKALTSLEAGVKMMRKHPPKCLSVECDTLILKPFQP